VLYSPDELLKTLKLGLSDIVKSEFSKNKPVEITIIKTKNIPEKIWD